MSSLSSLDVCIAGDINLDAGKYGNIPAPTRELYEAWLDLTRTNGLDLLATGPTYKSLGKYQGHHFVSTLDQVYISVSVPAKAMLLPDSATDHLPVNAELDFQKKGSKASSKALETVLKRNLASICPAVFRKEIKDLGINNWPTPRQWWRGEQASPSAP